MTAPGPMLEASNPATLEPRDDDRPDPQVTYELDGIRFGEYDVDGNWWICLKTAGWHDPVKRRTSRAPRAYADGAYRGRSRKDARTIELSGICVSPSIGARQAALERFADCCGDDGRLHTLQVTDQLGRVRTADVELDDAAAPLTNERRFAWRLGLTAPDPRKHGAWQDPVAPLPGLRNGALAWPLSFPLDFGQPPATGGIVQVANYGTATAHPLFTLHGPMPSPVIYDDRHGYALEYRGDIVDGETVTINCDDFAARGFRGHACWSSESGSVRSRLKIGTEWPAVDPGSTGVFRLASPAVAPAELMTSLRSAYR